MTTDLKILSLLPWADIFHNFTLAQDSPTNGLTAHASNAESLFNVLHLKLKDILQLSAIENATSIGCEKAETNSDPICVARKPLDGTVAQNVIKHGCGAINLDGCRIEGEAWSAHEATGLAKTKFFTDGETPIIMKEPHEHGRFPANVIFDEEAAAVLDQQTGQLTSGSNCFRKTGNNSAAYGKESRPPGTEMLTYGDSGGASRFFYCAKASGDDRNYGCEGLALKDPACVTDFRPSLKSNPENWANGTENAYMRTTPKANNHPTVKPISLMRYLVRLVKTPLETCTIADFFMGSGTTGIACMLEGINFIGCDADENSFIISQSRIEYAKNDYLKQQAKPKQAELFKTEVKEKKASLVQPNLF